MLASIAEREQFRSFLLQRLHKNMKTKKKNTIFPQYPKQSFCNVEIAKRALFGSFVTM